MWSLISWWLCGHHYFIYFLLRCSVTLTSYISWYSILCINLCTQLQTPAPVNPTPFPTNPPVSASCGLCAVDSSKSCTSDIDCPLKTEGVCTQGNAVGATCTLDGNCGPTSGKPASRGVCTKGTTVCNVNSCPPTKAPTPSPTNAPTKQVSKDYLNADGAICILYSLWEVLCQSITFL
jgi:hypothetical protein